MLSLAFRILGLCIICNEILGQGNTLFPVKMNQKWGYINPSGQIRISPAYTYAGDFDMHSFALTILSDKAGLINQKGEIVIPHNYDKITWLIDDYFAVWKDNMVGIEKAGKGMVYSCSAASVSPLSAQLFLVQQGEKFGAVNTHGEVQIPFQYDHIKYLDDTLLLLTLHQKFGLCDIHHKQILNPSYDRIWFSSETKKDFIFFRSGNKTGFMSLRKNIFCKPIWDSYTHFGPHFLYCSTKNKHTLYALHTEKNRSDSIGTPLSTLNTHFLMVKLNEQVGVLDTNGRFFIPPLYTHIKTISDHLFALEKNHKWALADTKGNLKTNFIYTDIYPLVSMFCLVKKGAYWGLIDQRAIEIVKPLYQQIDQTEHAFKLYSGKKNLTILHYNASGIITGKEDYTEVETIHIGIPEKTIVSSANLSNPMDYYHKLGWYKDSLRNKWGLKDSMGKWMIHPVFSSIEINDSLQLTEVSMESSPVQFYVGKKMLTCNLLHGLVDHRLKKIIFPVKYAGIAFSDFKSGTGLLARFMKTNGSWGLMDRKGKILLENKLYIGPNSCGLTRVFEKGKIISGEDGYLYQTSIVLDELQHFIDNLPAQKLTYTYEEKKSYLNCTGGRWYYVNTAGNMAHFDSLSYFSYARDFVNKTAIVQIQNNVGLLTTDHILLPLCYGNIDYLPHSENNLLLVQKTHSRYGYIHKNGKVLSAFDYQSANDFHNHFASVCKAGKWGFIDSLGNEICEPTYTQVKDFSEGMAAFQKKGKWGFMDENGEEQIPCVYKRTGRFSDGLCPVQIQNKWGYINASGTLVIPCIYLHAESFVNGYALVTLPKGKGLINVHGKKMISCKYKNLSNVDRFGYLIATRKNKLGLLNVHGSKIIPFRYRYLSGFQNGYALIYAKKGYGYIDSTGHIAIKPKYLQAGLFKEDRALVMKNGHWHFIDKKGIPCYTNSFTQARNFQNGLAQVSNHKLQTFINYSGKIIMPYQYAELHAFSANGIARITANKQDYFITKSGLPIRAMRFDKAMDFTENLAFVCKKGKWGLLDAHGLFAVSCKYAWAKGFKEGASVIRQKNVSGIFSADGNWLIKPLYDSIEYVDHQVYRIESNEKIGYLETNGKWLWNLSD